MKSSQPPVSDPRCLYCNEPFEQRTGPGRPRKFCRRSHRQRYYEQNRRPMTLKSLHALAEHFDYLCYMCGTQLDEDSVEFDHVLPTSKDGPDALWNLRPVCHLCNLKKAASVLYVMANPEVET